MALCEGAQQGCTVTHCEQQGPTVTFNLRRADGSYVGHREVAKLAELHSIVLRVSLPLCVVTPRQLSTSSICI